MAWVHPKGANRMAVSGLRSRKVLLGTGRAIFGINGLRKLPSTHSVHIVYIMYQHTPYARLEPRHGGGGKELFSPPPRLGSRLVTLCTTFTNLDYNHTCNKQWFIFFTTFSDAQYTEGVCVASGHMWGAEV